MATFAFVSSDAPYYLKGYAVLMTGLCITAVSSLIYLMLVWRENGAARQRAGAGDEGAVAAAETISPNVL